LNGELAFVLVVLAVTLTLFVGNRLRLDLIAVLSLLALTLGGVVSTEQALAGFSDPVVVMIAGLFVVGAAMFRTGVADAVGRRVESLAGHSPRRLVVTIMLATALLSAFLSSTGTVAVMLPVVLAIARRRGIAPSRLLIPLAYAALLGGMLTLIGTPPNLIVSSQLVQAGLEPFGFFQFTPPGLIMLAIGVAFMTLAGPYLIPERRSADRWAATGAAPLTPYQEQGELVQAPPVVGEEDLRRPERAPLAVAIMALMLLVMTFELVAHVIAVLGAAAALVLGRCVTMEEAYRSINWESVVLIAAIIPMGSALANTGGLTLAADAVLALTEGAGPLALMAVLFVFTSVLSQLISNTATTVLLAPIAIQAALTLGLNPHAVLLTVAVAASTAFATPVASPVNTLVLGPGGYRFGDYARAGIPLQLLLLGATLVVVPLLFPL
jgi:solute carrier family 13 (sodium-dependent dicarboxylate transporter), member 2/3/5